MRKLTVLFTVTIFLLFLTACQEPQPGGGAQTTPTAQAVEPTAAATPTPASGAASSPMAVTLLYTSDEHGWMEGEKPGEGAANMLGLWQTKEGYPGKGRFLVLSGGDNWTGPAISTWYQGESMLEVMGLMGYQASAIGNHEFDFGLDNLKDKVQTSKYPYLAANITYQSSGKPLSDLGVKPFTLLDLDGLSVGVIGLSTAATAYTANPAIVSGLKFGDYAAALTQAAGEARKEGAQMVVLVSHLCEPDLIALIPTAKQLDIPVMGGGHCHLGFSQKIGDVSILDSDAYLQSYGYAHLIFDPATGKTQIKDVGVQHNTGGKADPTVAAAVQKWAEKTKVEGGVVIGYLKDEIPRQGATMQALIVESWLWAYPQADVALTNLGGMRDKLPKGDITLAGITSVMPFNNTIVEVHIRGDQLEKILEGKLVTPPAIGGVRYANGKWILAKTGKPLDAKATYSILVNDFMYAGGDHYDDLAKDDPNAYFTAIDWRQPVIDWIKAQNSSESSPLEAALKELMK